ncbi:MAG TPA: conjugal transfer protein TraR [Desulfotomaculum sp.]|nr:conjugal transfer protein TraR [Desulfotomaculum sp.]
MDLRQMRQCLEEEKIRLLERIDSLNKTGLAASLRDSTGELSLADNNPADIGSEVFERSKDFAFREDNKIKIKAIDDALAKIENGSYGKCEICGQQISLKRLEAMPYTTLCYACKTENEQKAPSSGRPVEEEVIKRISRQALADDFEDAWQEVTPYSEHAAEAGAGSYYGGETLTEEEQDYS